MLKKAKRSKFKGHNRFIIIISKSQKEGEARRKHNLQFTMVLQKPKLIYWISQDEKDS
jgi:hypothetical protein